MARYRWLNAEWPMTTRTLAKRIRQQEFGEGRANGFILDRVRDDALEARFVERYEYTETVSDPYGKELTFERLEFRQAAFRATASWPGIEIVDAPRSTQSLVSSLLEACNFELSISPINVNVMEWANELQHALGADALIDSLQIAALVVAEGVKGKVLLKGDKDVRAAYKALVHGRSHLLEKLQLRMLFQGTGCTVTLSNVAGAKVDGSDTPTALIQQLRASLPAPTVRS
jgi:hypothetical protein